MRSVKGWRSCNLELQRLSWPPPPRSQASDGHRGTHFSASLSHKEVPVHSYETPRMAKQVYCSFGTAIAKCQRLGGLNNRNLLSHVSRVQNSESKVLAELVSPGAFLLGS